MEKVKSFFHNLSFRKSFILYVCVALFAAYLASGFTSSYCRQTIFLNYPMYSEDEIIYTTEDGSPKLFQNKLVYSEEDNQKIDILNMIAFWCVPVYVGIAVVIAAMLFYHKKMKKPLDVLGKASDRISDHDLNFTVVYSGKDEMGKLCASFEKMRDALYMNNHLMWQQMEQRKRLNAAFAHDLRTPLTILKGHLEMMQNGSEPKYKNASMMTKQIDRLEQYVDSMSGMQKLEDIEPQRREVITDDLIKSIKQMSEFICRAEEKSIDFQTHTTSKSLCLDESIVYQVTENIVSNAARYAASRIDVSLTEENDMISIIVYDDGIGFSPESLEHAAEPYYTASQNRGSHLGLGLYISKILMQHHGGDIYIENFGSGAKVTATFCVK